MPYVYHSIYRTNGNIKPTIETLNAISDLLFSHAAGEGVAENIADLFSIATGGERDAFVDNLRSD